MARSTLWRRQAAILVLALALAACGRKGAPSLPEAEPSVVVPESGEPEVG